MNLRMVIDASAVCRFPSMRVGEVIAEINDDGVQFGVSTAALVAAATRVGMVPVEILVKNAAFSSLDLSLDWWRSIVAAVDVIPDVGDAHGAVIALRSDCDILTARPELYAGLGDDPPIIAI